MSVGTFIKNHLSPTFVAEFRKGDTKAHKIAKSNPFDAQSYLSPLMSRCKAEINGEQFVGTSVKKSGNVPERELFVAYVCTSVAICLRNQVIYCIALL